MKHLGFLLYLAIFNSSTVGAATFKCTDDAGKTIYTDQPCADSKTAKQISIVDNSSDSTEFRRLIDRGRDERRSMGGDAEDGIPKYTAGSIGPSRQDKNCFDAKRSYEIEVSSIRKDLKAMWDKFGSAKILCGNDLQMLDEHIRLNEIASRKNSRRSANASEGPPPNPNNFYIPKGTGYISPRGEFCTAVKDGAMCPTGGYIRIYRN